MFYDVFNYYKENCGAYHRVFVEMKKLYYMPNLLPVMVLLIIIAAVALFAMEIIKYSATSINLVIIVTLVVIFSVGFMVVNLFNKKAKEIVKKRYGIKVNSFMWNTDEVSKQLLKSDKKIMQKYMKDNSYSKDKIRRLTKAIKEEMPIYKPKFPVIPSIFAALFVSLWNNQFSWMYSKLDTTNLRDSFIIFLFGLFCMVMFGVLLFVIKGFCSAVNDMLYLKDYESIKRLYRIIEEILEEQE